MLDVIHRQFVADSSVTRWRGLETINRKLVWIGRIMVPIVLPLLPMLVLPAVARDVSERRLEISAPGPTFEGSQPSPHLLARPVAPEDEVAPPGLAVGEKDEPIVFLESIAMRRELANLLGRFQNAHLALTGDGALRDIDTVVARVQETLQRFPQVVAAQDYGQARQEWLQARQQIWTHYPDSRPTQPEIRAIWLDRGTIVEAGSPQGLEKIFDRLAAAGFNLVFLETVNAGYPIYPSWVAPAQNPLTLGWDPLGAGVEFAHERGMELHAWVWTFAVGNVAHNRLLGQSWNFLGPVATLHPDWLNYDHQLRAIQANSGKIFLDHANPEAKDYLLRLFEEIVSRYDVDGLQLDYIRYPFQDIAGGFTFGYGQEARKQFRQLTGADPLGLQQRSSLWQDWLDFRTAQVDDFVVTVNQRLQRVNPDLTLSVAVFPHPTHERLAKIQQNWERWAKQGDIDLVVLMAYAFDTNRFQKLTEPWLFDPDLRSTPVIAGVHLPSLEDVGVLDQVQFLRDSASLGYSLFAVDQLNPNLQARFSPGSAEAGWPVNVLPHRQPFMAAALRFKALEQEWDWFVGQDKVWIREADLETWQVQRVALAQALENLVQQPTPATLAEARTTLSEFEVGFEDWLHLQGLENAYQTQTWEFRLKGLNVLLNYGERTALR